MTVPYPNLKSFLTKLSANWDRHSIHMLWNKRRLLRGMWTSARRRKRIRKTTGLSVPMGIGISPTMNCNLECLGCYSRLHPKHEIEPGRLSSFITEAADAGVFFFVISGGEPYMRTDLLSLCGDHGNCLFLTVTNGTLITAEIAKRIGKIGNVFPVLSIEGTKEDTDFRRGEGVYEKVLSAMGLLREAAVPFGFSSVITKHSIATLAGHSFLEDMEKTGCSLGIFNDLIPITPEDWENVAPEEEKKSFRDALVSRRKDRSMLLLHLPHDEYDDNGHCLSVGRGSFHVNAEGWVEPCPFAHFAVENINTAAFGEIIASPFLKAIREHPTALKKGIVGCALVNNHEILKHIAAASSAVHTSNA